MSQFPSHLFSLSHLVSLLVSLLFAALVLLPTWEYEPCLLPATLEIRTVIIVLVKAVIEVLQECLPVYQ